MEPRMKNRIVGFAGKAGSGKDSLGAHLIEELELRGIPAKRFAFGDAVKEWLELEYGLDMKIMHSPALVKNNAYTNILWDHERDNTCPPPEAFMTYREAMQYLGTDVGRAEDDDRWINETLYQVAVWHQENPEGIAIITDVRFPNEADYIVNLESGIQFDIKSSIDRVNGHSSEAGGLNYTLPIFGKGHATLEESQDTLMRLVFNSVTGFTP